MAGKSRIFVNGGVLKRSGWGGLAVFWLLKSKKTTPNPSFTKGGKSGYMTSRYETAGFTRGEDTDVCLLTSDY